MKKRINIEIAEAGLDETPEGNAKASYRHAAVQASDASS